MKCVIAGWRIRAFSKAVRLMSKYTDMVTILANPTGMVFQVANDSMSAFAEVEFNKEFFSEYSPVGCPFECKIDIKSLVLVFPVITLGMTCGPKFALQIQL